MTQDPQDTTPQQQDLYDLLQGRIEHFPDRSIRRLFQNKPNVEALVKMIEPNLAVRIDFECLVPANRSLLPETLREQQADADLNRLKQLNLNASLAPSFRAFQQGLET